MLENSTTLYPYGNNIVSKFTLVTPLSLAFLLLDRRLCVLTFQFSLPLQCDNTPDLMV